MAYAVFVRLWQGFTSEFPHYDAVGALDDAKAVPALIDEVHGINILPKKRCEELYKQWEELVDALAKRRRWVSPRPLPIGYTGQMDAFTEQLRQLDDLQAFADKRGASAALAEKRRQTIAAMNRFESASLPTPDKTEEATITQPRAFECRVACWAGWIKSSVKEFGGDFSPSPMMLLRPGIETTEFAARVVSLLETRLQRADWGLVHLNPKFIVVDESQVAEPDRYAAALDGVSAIKNKGRSISEAIHHLLVEWACEAVEWLQAQSAPAANDAGRASTDTKGAGLSDEDRRRLDAIPEWNEDDWVSSQHYVRWAATTLLGGQPVGTVTERLKKQRERGLKPENDDSKGITRQDATWRRKDPGNPKTVYYLRPTGMSKEQPEGEKLS